MVQKSFSGFIFLSLLKVDLLPFIWYHRQLKVENTFQNAASFKHLQLAQSGIRNTFPNFVVIFLEEGNFYSSLLLIWFTAL